MIIKSHADQALITNFIITPMMFLGGTFFPTENLPSLIKPFIEILPLTITSNILRNIALNKSFDFSYLIILFFIALFSFILAFYSLKGAKD